MKLRLFFHRVALRAKGFEKPYEHTSLFSHEYAFERYTHKDGRTATITSASISGGKTTLDYHPAEPKNE